VIATASCVPDSLRQAGPASAADAPAVLAKAPPPPVPLLLKPVAPTEAMAINASIPLADGPNPRAASVVLRARTPIDQMRSLDCLAQAIYYEARSESEDGQRAVAQVVLNRLRHPTYPATVCGVVYQGSERSTGCQFTFTCDGSLALAPRGFSWDRARRIAAEALAGKVYAPVGHSTHYHTVAVLPYWASSLAKSAGDRRPHLLSLERRLGPAGRLSPALCRGRAGRRDRARQGGRPAAGRALRPAGAREAPARFGRSYHAPRRPDRGRRQGHRARGQPAAGQADRCRPEIGQGARALAE
jgi:spore germination cell wall hydrolase CwlJ-like protein